ncbi:D-aminopeptidase [Hypericibacter terrae]|uniref:D-aminopeptidase n=1 Tax=Hypericibacter terrae TaxID=2602015 RepID=A0A5J6MEZ8_9PROT|nr:P1 family peptidase [Hypericibacter terrae]QEX16058.1 D-aminopeptidase [Hypericibacter terrae]
MARPRLRDLGIVTGRLDPGPFNAITDVEGVRVGHSTLISDSPRVVRTGVTAIWPRDTVWQDWCFAGFHSFNGNGEMTGLPWIAEQGLIGAPLCITNTLSVGVVRDAICAYAIERKIELPFHLPVTAETWDGWLSDIDSQPVTQAMAFEALANAKGGPVAEGCVGGGTGMITHEFKGGIGTASRAVDTAGSRYTVGALVQSNYGRRHLLRVDGVPVGREITTEIVPSDRFVEPKSSIIVILATDAPLIPIQCQRLARRATTGLAWVGGIGGNGSGDIFLAFSTANTVRPDHKVSELRAVGPDEMTMLFEAAAEATEEAILNAMIAAETMVGFQNRIVHALPHDKLLEVMRRYRPPGTIGAPR